MIIVLFSIWLVLLVCYYVSDDRKYLWSLLLMINSLVFSIYYALEGIEYIASIIWLITSFLWLEIYKKVK
jgi:hypothetical protein